MNWTQITALILVSVATALIFYDIAAEIWGGNSSTISQVIYWASRSYPVVAFGAGVLCGHLFWPQAK